MSKEIKFLTERIEEEIHDAKLYAKMAAEYKNEFPALSHVLYTISTQEEAHQEMLHAEAVKLIEAYRKEHGTPPPAMMAVYQHLHEKAIEKMAEAKHYQEIYKRA